MVNIPILQIGTLSYERICPKGHNWLVAETNVKPGSTDSPTWPDPVALEDTDGLGGREASSTVTLAKHLS